MKQLIIPKKLNAGDKVAFISVSGGRAGDEDMLPRYMLGKRKFEKIFNVEVDCDVPGIKILESGVS